MLTRPFVLKLNSIDESGGRPTFKGVGAPYSVPNAMGDTLRPGLFAKSITDRSGPFPLLWQHNTSEPIGSIEIANDSMKSLNVAGVLLADVIPRAREVYELMKAGAISGISVGFIGLRYSPPREDGSVEYTEARLCELSLVSVPAFEAARVTSVEAALHSLDGLTASELAHVRCSLDQKLGTGDSRLRDAFAAFDVARWTRR